MSFDKTRASPVLVVGKGIEYELEFEDDFGNDFRGWRSVFRSPCRFVGISRLVEFWIAALGHSGSIGESRSSPVLRSLSLGILLVLILVLVFLSALLPQADLNVLEAGFPHSSFAQRMDNDDENESDRSALARPPRNAAS